MPSLYTAEEAGIAIFRVAFVCGKPRLEPSAVGLPQTRFLFQLATEHLATALVQLRPEWFSATAVRGSRIGELTPRERVAEAACFLSDILLGADADELALRLWLVLHFIATAEHPPHLARIASSTKRLRPSLAA